MRDSIRESIPIAQLKKLSFLLGDLTGIETLYPPNLTPIQFQAHFSGAHEDCERFLKLDFFGNLPGVGIETFESMITYSDSRKCYRMWIFASSQEDPLYLTGNFEGEKLVLISEPTPMVWGMQKLRYSLHPLADGSVDLLGERWEPDGYAKYCSVLLEPVPELGLDSR